MYPFTAREATCLGLPVHTDLPAEIYQFMELFLQQTWPLPSVEYVPPPERHGQGKRS
jgi:Serine dehydrogenase proteinase